MSSGLLISVLIGGLGIGGAVGYIGGAASAKSPSHSVAGGRDTLSTPWFRYDGKTYDGASLPPSVQDGLFKSELDSYNQQLAIIREYAVRLVLAKEQKKSTDPKNLASLDELLPPKTVTDDEVKAFYEANKDKIPPNVTFDQVAPRIKDLLANQGRAKVFEDTWNKLNEGKNFELLAKKPVAPLVDIPVAQFPSKGTGSNVIVEVTDYLCPHCQEIQPQVKALLEKLGNKAKFVQINHSLRPQNLSAALVEGAYCAQKQGNDFFWKYHEAAFAKSAGGMGDPYDIAKAKPFAEAAGVKIADWDACMASAEPKEYVTKTTALVQSIGVDGTPTFFVNNRKVLMQNPHDVVGELEKALK